MTTVFVLSLLFFISYLIYHASVPETRFGAKGPIRYLYYFTLITHIFSSFVSLPLVLTALYFALSKQYSRHKRIVRFAYPLWLYVAISGVITYLFLRPYYPTVF